jgi:hypothetical protein
LLLWIASLTLAMTYLVTAYFAATFALP